MWFNWIGILNFINIWLYGIDWYFEWIKNIWFYEYDRKKSYNDLLEWETTKRYIKINLWNI